MPPEVLSNSIGTYRLSQHPDEIKHDACGTFVTSPVYEAGDKPLATHQIVEDSLCGLGELDSRGGTSTDGTGDGAGLVTGGMPIKFLNKMIAQGEVFLYEDAEIQKAGSAEEKEEERRRRYAQQQEPRKPNVVRDIQLVDGETGLGRMFLPTNPEQLEEARRIIEDSLRANGFNVAGWRKVAVDLDAAEASDRVKQAMPTVEDIIFTKGNIAKDTPMDPAELEARAIQTRIEIENLSKSLDLGIYACSFSKDSIAHKGMFRSCQVSLAYKDLSDVDFEAAWVGGHNRMATNTGADPRRAQPGTVWINGEMNTIKGDRINRKIHLRERHKKKGGDADSLSDSQHFGAEVRELIRDGFAISEAVTMLMTPTIEDDDPNHSAEVKAMLKWFRRIRDGYGGPCHCIFASGQEQGAKLDSGGLRPSRYVVVQDKDTGLKKVHICSEDMYEYTSEEVLERGSLRPGEMILIRDGKILKNKEILEQMAAKLAARMAAEHNNKFVDLLNDHTISLAESGHADHVLPKQELLPVQEPTQRRAGRRHVTLAYDDERKDSSRMVRSVSPEPVIVQADVSAAAMPVQVEELPLFAMDEKSQNEFRQKKEASFYDRETRGHKIIPMAVHGAQNVMAMGDDTPMAAKRARASHVSAYAKQRGAQVTAPARDATREESDFLTKVYLGANPDKHSDSRQIEISSPILSSGQLEAIEDKAALGQGRIGSRRLDFTCAIQDIDISNYEAKSAEDKAAIDLVIQENMVAMRGAIMKLCEDAEAAVRGGTTILVLDNHNLGKNRASIPDMIAVSAINQHLIDKGLRLDTSIVVNSSQVADPHQAAMLLAFGASAVAPSTAYQDVSQHLSQEIVNVQEMPREQYEQELRIRAIKKAEEELRGLVRSQVHDEFVKEAWNAAYDELKLKEDMPNESDVAILSREKLRVLETAGLNSETEARFLALGIVEDSVLRGLVDNPETQLRLNIYDLMAQGYSPEQVQGHLLPALCDNYQHAMHHGLLKTMSMSGITDVNNYIGGRLVEFLGIDLSNEPEKSPEVAINPSLGNVFQECSSPIKGHKLSDVVYRSLHRHMYAYSEGRNQGLQFSGEFHDDKDLIPHSYGHSFNQAYSDWLAQEELAEARGLRRLGHKHNGKYTPEFIDGFEQSGAYRDLSRKIEARRKEARITISDDFEVISDRVEIAKDQVQNNASILDTITAGGMSYGALTLGAWEAIAEGMNAVGARSNAGEGGERQESLGSSKSAKIKQTASGRFGISPEMLAAIKKEGGMMEIKVAQGAKPWVGGQLPEGKVSINIAALRGGLPGIALISPPPHHDVYSIEDLKELVYDLKAAGIKVGVKIVASEGIGQIACGVVKSGADEINIAGGSGGTGAALETGVKNAGMPAEVGVREVHNALIKDGLRDKVKLKTSGSFKNGVDIVKAAIVGADGFEFGTSLAFAVGCKMLRLCNVPGGCGPGVTNNEKDFRGKKEDVERYMLNIVAEVREVLAQLGYKSLDEIRGRVELLKELPPQEVSNGRIDYTRMLQKTVQEQELHAQQDQARLRPVEQQAGIAEQKAAQEVIPKKYEEERKDDEVIAMIPELAEEMQRHEQISKAAHFAAAPRIKSGHLALVDSGAEEKIVIEDVHITPENRTFGARIAVEACQIYKRRPQEIPAITEQHDVGHAEAKDVNSHVRRLRTTSPKLKRGEKYVSEDHVTVETYGCAGQSYGFVNAHGIWLKHTGTVNDGLGKSCAGGVVSVTTPMPKKRAVEAGDAAVVAEQKDSEFRAEDNVAAGNAVGYGAYGGKILVNGQVGDRCGICLHGGTIVTEGAGNFLGSFATSGTILNIGKTGQHVGAGMQGGVIFQYDEQGTLEQNLYDQSVRLATDTETTEYHASIKKLLEEHRDRSGSQKATAILADWDVNKDKFKVVMSKEMDRFKSADKVQEVIETYKIREYISPGMEAWLQQIQRGCGVEALREVEERYKATHQPSVCATQEIF